MKKNKQLIMRIAGTILFAIALILTLNLLFNGSKIDKKYVGSWMVGYKFYQDDTENKLLTTFEQELHLSKDGTFYTMEQYIPSGSKNRVLSGKFKTINNKVILTFEKNGKEQSRTLTLKDKKLCIDDSCEKYYQLDKIDKYIIKHNASLVDVEE